MRARAVGAIADIRSRHENGDTVVVISHGDVIKAILSDALAQGFDDFQRLNVAPASVSIVDYSHERPFVVCINANSDVAGLLAAPVAPVVGGGDVAHKVLSAMRHGFGGHVEVKDPEVKKSEQKGTAK